MDLFSPSPTLLPMPFTLPQYSPPNFSTQPLSSAPFARFRQAPQTGVLPDEYHATSIYPEYCHLRTGGWRLVEDSRMDCGIVLGEDGSLQVKEFRHIVAGDLVACGRREDGEDGIFVHANGFAMVEQAQEKFSFRTRVTRETSFSIDYDELYDLLHYEKENGFILWVLGPAVVFDRDARAAIVALINKGYVHGLLAGNGLAVHDIEGDLYGTALGQKIYSKQPARQGHYNHLDTINRIRAEGSIDQAVHKKIVQEGIMHAVTKNSIPYVLAGSIRDDGPLPDVLSDVLLAQDKMRELARQATTVIALATQLHTIATGNMVSSYRVLKDKQVRPTYFYTVDMSEFVVNKLANRGSLSARTILTNVQDFAVTLAQGLQRLEKS